MLLQQAQLQQVILMYTELHGGLSKTSEALIHTPQLLLDRITGTIWQRQSHKQDGTSVESIHTQNIEELSMEHIFQVKKPQVR
jgi:hypothetical protein